jgi:spermidine synthase
MTQGLDASGERAPRALILMAFALSGAASLTYEVVWTRSLSVILGSTTYALSSMLATFMLGLAIGGVVGGRYADRTVRPTFWLGLVEMAVGALGIASHLVIEALPAVYLSAYRAFHLSAPAYVAAQIALCSLVMLAPTVLMGMTFPLVTRALVRGVDEVGRVVGLAYGANTLGAVVGAWTAGFLLIPGLGLRGATLVAAGANALVAILLLARARGRRDRYGLLLLLAYVPIGAVAFSAGRSSRMINFYTAYRHTEGADYATLERIQRATLQKVFEREGADGYVAAFRDGRGHLLLQVGGKLEGTTESDLPNTELLSYLPVASHAAPRSMLVIGLGAGVTLDVARRIVPRVDLVEISGDVLEAIRLHGPPGVLEGPRVFKEDARNLLLRAEEQWDVISSEPSYPTDFSVSNLFSVEFYRLAEGRLAKGGVFCQWLPYYLLTNDDVTMMIKTFGSVFPHAMLWKVEGSMDLLLVGSDSPFARDDRAIKERVDQLSTRPLAFDLSRSSEKILEIVRRADIPLNTDDRPRLEFSVARNLRIGDLSLPD